MSRELTDDPEAALGLASTPLTRTRRERNVAMVVVLFPASGDEPRLGPTEADELARLGVTSVTVLRDTSLAGLVLEGWAFDPHDARRAAAAVVGARARLRFLQPLVQMAVSNRRE
jgi:hypothetical protein